MPSAALYDLFQVLHASLVLDLGNDGDIHVFFDEDFPHPVDVICRLNKGGRDVVHIILGRKAKLPDDILAVLGTDGTECKPGIRQVHALAVTQPATVDDTADNRGVNNRRYFKFYGAIIKQDWRTGTDFLKQFPVAHADTVHIAGPSVGEQGEAGPR